MSKVISLELAKELVEVAEEHGVALPDAEYSHILYTHGRYLYVDNEVANQSEVEDFQHAIIDIFPAYQTDEILEMLKSTVHIVKQSDDNYSDDNYMASTAEIEIETFGDTPREAIGELLKYLIKNGLWGGK